MASEFSLEAVKDCMLSRGGRIRNHELVTHFKEFLNHPENKIVNREKFKDYVNELATIKVEDGDKILVLKRKHRPEGGESVITSSSSSLSPSRSSEFTSQQPPPAYKGEQSRQQTRDSSYNDRTASPGEGIRARSEPPERADATPRAVDRVDGGHMSKVHSDDSLDVRNRSSGGPGGHKPGQGTSTSSLNSSASSSAVSGSGEDEGNTSILSIRERVQHLNKISSESDVQQSRAPRKSKIMKDRDDDDDSHTSVTLSPEEKEWMLVSASADYHEMFKLLNKNLRLAKVKDIANGYTALHWAAKFGKPEVVKMLANKMGVNVNQRSHGGYTPLHLAAIQGHEDVIELLVTVYKADPNLRDYSGKKAKQYLKNSASSRAQQLLVSRKLAPDFGGSGSSLNDSFTRSVTARQSNRARAISSLIQATSSSIRQPVQAVLRSSWEGDNSGDGTPGSTPPGSLTSSPASGRKSHRDEKHLMPPPHHPAHRRRIGVDRSRSSSRESLNSQPVSQSTSAIDKQNNNNNQPSSGLTVPRSESDPALAKKTFT